MISQVTHRESGEPTVLGLTEHLVNHYWETRPRPQGCRWLHQWLVLMQDLIEGNYRAEGYVLEDGEIVSVYIANPAVDPHYGEIAYPVVDWVNPRFRFNRAALREHSKLREKVTKELGASGYLTVKHINDHTQIQRVRYVHE